MATLNDGPDRPALSVEQLGPWMGMHVLPPARFIIDGKRADHKVGLVSAGYSLSHMLTELAYLGVCDKP